MKRLRESESQQQLTGRPSSARLRPMPVTVSGVSFVSAVWILLTFVLTCGLIVAAGFPYWALNTNPPIHLPSRISRAEIGLYHFCYNLTVDETFRECSTYLQFSPPENVTSDLEQVQLQDIAFFLSSSVIYGFGCGMLAISFIVAIIAFFKPRIKKQSIFLVAFIIQIIANISLIAALALFPAGFGSNFLKLFCGLEADYYNRGYCTLGWSLYVAMVTTACSLYLPSLAIFSMNISDGLRGNICF